MQSAVKPSLTTIAHATQEVVEEDHSNEQVHHLGRKLQVLDLTIQVS